MSPSFCASGIFVFLPRHKALLFIFCHIKKHCLLMASRHDKGKKNYVDVLKKTKSNALIRSDSENL